jgi:hypothetical protein
MAEVVNYAKAQGWMDAQGANPTRMMAYVVGSEEADADKMPCKSRQSVNANLVAGDGINIVDGEISVNMSEVQRGTGMTALAQRVTNAETNIEEVRRLATQREEVTIGNLDINKLVSSERIYNKTYDEGAPIFKTCEELIKFRK